MTDQLHNETPQPKPSWGQVAEASADAARAETTPQETPANTPPPEEASSAAPEPAAEERKIGDTEVFDILYAAGAGSALSVDAISDELNADKAKPHTAKGPIEAELLRLIARGRVGQREEGSPPIAVYFLQDEGREEVDAPAIVRGARTAILAVIGPRLSYSGEGVVFQAHGLELFDIAHALRHANLPTGPTIPEDAVSAFFYKFTAADTADVEARVLQRLHTLLGTLVEEAKVQPPALVGADAAPPEGAAEQLATLTVYRLTASGQTAFIAAGAEALAASTFPPGPTKEEIRADFDRIVAEAVRKADGRAEMFRNLYEAQRGEVAELRGVVTIYEQFHKTTGIHGPPVLMNRKVDPAEVMDFEEERVIDEEELARLIEETDALKRYILTETETEGRRKKTEVARLEGLKARVEGNWRLITQKGGRHIVKKKVTREVRKIGGKHLLITFSADPHDAGKELKREVITGTYQTALPGCGEPGKPEYKAPEEAAPVGAPSAPPTPLTSSSVAPEGTAPPAPAVTSPEAPPTPPEPRRWTKPVELSLKGLKPAIEEFLRGETAGVLQHEFAGKFCAFLNIEAKEAPAKIIATLVKQGMKSGHICLGESGQGEDKGLLWWHENPDPRLAGKPAQGAPKGTQVSDKPKKPPAKGGGGGKGSKGKAAAGAKK